MIKVKKLHDKAELPRYAHSGDSCFDLFATGDVSWEYDNGVLTATVPIGLAFEIEPEHTMFIFSRSGHGFNYGVTLANCTGVIDSNFRGEVKIKLTSHNRIFDIERGVKVAQACVIATPMQFFEVVDELSDSERGEKGFGSTDKEKL